MKKRYLGIVLAVLLFIGVSCKSELMREESESDIQTQTSEEITLNNKKNTEIGKKEKIKEIEKIDPEEDVKKEKENSEKIDDFKNDKKRSEDKDKDINLTSKSKEGKITSKKSTKKIKNEKGKNEISSSKENKTKQSSSATKVNESSKSKQPSKPKKPSKPKEPSKPNNPSKPAHKHDYKPVYKTVKIPAKTKEEKKWIVTKPAEKKQYRRTIYTSNDTGKKWVYDPRTMSKEEGERIAREIDDYNIEQALSGGVGSNMVNFENYWHETKEEGYWETKTVVVTPETSKKVVDYEQCSCGARR